MAYDLTDKGADSMDGDGMRRYSGRTVQIFAAFHYDLAYRDTFEGYMPRSLEIIDAGLDMLAANEEYIFCIEQIVLLDAYWRRRPERRADLKRYAREKRLIFCPGIWSMPDGNIPNAESCYRNALMGRAWLGEHLQVEPGPICWMADIFGHHAQSPQIYGQLGYGMYMFERGQFQEEETVDFVWEGIDGSRLPAHWEKDTYYGLSLGLSWMGSRSREWIAGRIDETVIQPLNQRPGRSMLSKIGGDFLRPRQEHLDFIEWWNGNTDGPRFEFSHPERYIREMAEAEDLGCITGELNPLMQGTYSTRIRLKQNNRIAEGLIFALEALDALLDIKAGDELNDLWRRVLNMQFHDIICGSLCDKAWREAEADSVRLSDDLQTSLKKRLAPGKDTVIFNPLPYSRTEVVSLPGGPELVVLDAMELTESSTVRRVRAPEPARAENNVLDNGLVRAEIDELGRLAYLEDLTTGAVYNDERFGYLHDIVQEPDYGDPWVYRHGPVNSSLLHNAPVYDPVSLSGLEITRQGACDRRGRDSRCLNLPKIQMRMADNGSCARITVGREQENLTVSYTLEAGEKLLRIKVTHKLGSIQRRLRAVMPTGIEAGTIRREIPAGYIEQAEGEYPAQNWMDYGDGRQGLCLLNKGLPGNNVTDGVMLLSLYRSVVMMEPGVMPDYELEEEQTAEYALLPFVPGDSAYDPVRQGRLYNQPLITVQDKALPRERGLKVCIERGRAEILEYRRIGRGQTELRLHESAGSDGTVTLCITGDSWTAYRITPAGEVLEPLRPVDGERLGLHLKPFEIITLMIVAG